MSYYASTQNGAVALATTGSNLVDLFNSIGSARNNKAISSLFNRALAQDPLKATAILLWSRDHRNGGAGERNTFRKLCVELSKVHPDLAEKVVSLIPKIGRYDDLTAFYSTSLKATAASVWADAMRKDDALAFKWADRKDKALREALGLRNEAELRKFIANGRKNKILEEKICLKEYSKIDYSKIPSVAGSRYAKLFKKNDTLRYQEFITSKTSKVNASALFPYDVYRMTKAGQGDAASKYWNSLPKLNVSGRVLPVVDVSGSMSSAKASGMLTCMDVAVSLGAYLSMNIEGAFNRKLITFSDDPTLVKIPKTDDIREVFTFCERMKWGGSTDIEKTFRAILNDAVKNNVPKNQMPDFVLILSDMQFNQGTTGGSNTTNSVIKKMFKEKGYDVPKLVYWNLNSGYGNFPTANYEKDVALVSGFSPNVMKAVLSAKSFSPVDVMNEAIIKFEEMLNS